MCVPVNYEYFLGKSREGGIPCRCVIELAAFSWKGNNSGCITSKQRLVKCQVFNVMTFQGILQQNLLVIFTHWPAHIIICFHYEYENTFLSI